jgi:hypothetical protein
MINELYTMARTLKEKNLLQVTIHSDINGPAASNAGIYIEIDRDGIPKNIEYIPKESFSKLWKHSKGNHNSFPIIRIQKAMIKHNLSNSFDEIWKRTKHKGNKIEILAQLDYCSYNLNSADILVSQWTQKQLLPICKDTPKLGALYALINRFPKSQEDQKKFYLAFFSLVKAQLATFEEPLLELLKDILIGRWDEKKGEFLSSTQIAFDVYDAYEFEYKVKDIKLKNMLIQELNKRDDNESQSLETESCQLTGEHQAILKDKYPDPNLPNLGKTYLYSNNENIHCLTRYNMKSLQAFKVGKGTVVEINNALGFLTQDDREYKTWVKVPGSKDDERNLLIAYVENEPDIDEDLAKLLGDAPNYEQEVIRFENLTEQVCKSLKEKTERNPNAQVKVIIINKVDDGRKQVVLSENYSVNEIIFGTAEWQKASGNHPTIEYQLRIKQEEIIINPFCPYPGQILNFMKKKWKWEIKNGKRDLKFEKTPGISLKEIYDVFIPLGNKQELYKHLLQKVCQRAQDLMINVGHCYNRKKLFEINKSAVYDHCLAVSLLSILLFKLKYCKEDYMHSVAFNIGRLMMLTDVLHREYCINVRKGDVPPQLLGNSIMPTAVEFPNKALNLLQERIRVYKAWADTVKEANLAKWSVSKMGDVSLEISEKEIPESFSEAERAQVLLGYLAKIEKQ